MAEQMTTGQLIEALETFPADKPVIIAGFGIANVPGDLRRHRSHLNDLGIEVVHERMGRKTVELFTMMLRAHATQPVTTFNPNPTTQDSPAWILPPGETTKSFFAVTRVDSFSSHVVIRAEDVAPVQGPSIQRVSDEEMLRRNFELNAYLDPRTPGNRYLPKAIAAEHTKARHRLQSAREDLLKLLAEIPRLEVERARIDYILGITDSRPE
jgi:hypothetical protein